VTTGSGDDDETIVVGRWWPKATVEREGEEREKIAQKKKEIGWFLAKFRPDCFLPQTMKSTYIYKQWKRAILSTLGENYSP
jgi:hypothetical protein